MNPFDLLAVVVVAIGLLAGFRSGALPQFGGLLGALVGGAVAVVLLPTALDLLRSLDAVARAVAVLAWLLACVGIGEALGSTAGRALSRSLGRGFLGALDQVGGALVGLAQAILVVWLAGGLVADAPLPGLSDEARRSVAVRALDRALPPPVAIAADLRRALDATGLPDVFVGLEPAPAPPAALPDDPEVREIAALALPSTVRIASPACGVQLSGSGVVVDRGYVVTNAHVVAGSARSSVATASGSTEARTVLFDGDLDVALLYVPGLDAPALRFATSDPPIHAIGAAIGYPGGGPARVVAAAVSRELHAVGRDIHDDHQVTREVLELHADIERGDSGGPLVLANGTVGGLVFAQSRSEPDVGYALSPTAVRATIAPALGRTDPVDTGTCTS
ncbi:MAG TPA: MarP family serine protease [Candidatus Limnocylindrales bacterium]|nr:MarP family serine protease [Candidatus Limnocylindrales bacterium]